MNVRPSTIVRWHRLGWRIFWRLKCRSGRPAIPAELRMLIRRMARENPLWGQERIAYELLLKIGIRVSPRTVAKYIPKRPPGQPRGESQANSLSDGRKVARNQDHPPRLDSPLDVPRKLPAENQILRSDRRRRAKEQHAEPHNVGKKTDDRSHHWPHVRIMPDSAADRRRLLGTSSRRQFLRATMPHAGDGTPRLGLRY